MDWLIETLERHSEKIGLVPFLLCAIAWIVGGAVVVREGVGALWLYPTPARVFLCFASLAVALGGLISFWILAPQVEFRTRGHQVRWRTGKEWAYEERRADGSVERLPFSLEMMGDGYRPPCEVQITSEVHWEQQAPPWARGRRPEILEHIARDLGADAGRQVQFKDAG